MWGKCKRKTEQKEKSKTNKLSYQRACADRALSSWKGWERTIAMSWRYWDLFF